MTYRLPFLILPLVITVSVFTSASAAKLPDATLDDKLASAPGTATLVLAGGCFWGVEEVFQHVRGVKDVLSGYAGGSARTATYQMVQTGTSGHAESVQITYNPSVVSMGQLLKVFFSVAHDPTQRGGQGPDQGPEYRSVVFVSGERQQAIAKGYIAQLAAARVYAAPITTQIVSLTKFYEAELEHQDYAQKHPTQPYIMVNDKPKVDDLRKEFAALYVK